MAFTTEYMFFDSADGDEREYPAASFAQYHNHFYRNGVIMEDDADTCLVTAELDLVSIRAGAVVINGYQGSVSGSDTLPRGTYKASVFMRLDVSQPARSILPIVETDSTIYPEPVREGNIYDLCLARLDVTNGNPVVTDTRNDYTLCGFAGPRGSPAYQPPGDIPAIVWQYVHFPDTLTPEQRAVVETSPAMMALVEGSRAMYLASLPSQHPSPNKVPQYDNNALYPVSRGRHVSANLDEYCNFALRANGKYWFTEFRAVDVQTGEIRVIPRPATGFIGIFFYNNYFYIIGNSANSITVYRWDGISNNYETLAYSSHPYASGTATSNLVLDEAVGRVFFMRQYSASTSLCYYYNIDANSFSSVGSQTNFVFSPYGTGPRSCMNAYNRIGYLNHVTSSQSSGLTYQNTTLYKLNTSNGSLEAMTAGFMVIGSLSKTKALCKAVAGNPIDIMAVGSYFIFDMKSDAMTPISFTDWGNSRHPFVGEGFAGQRLLDKYLVETRILGDSEL